MCITLRSVKRTRQELCGYRFISGFTLRNVSRSVSRYVSRDNLWGFGRALTFGREFYLRVTVLVCKTVL